MQHKLFVYGTLMSMFGNHRLLKEASYVGRFLVDGSLYGFGIPGFTVNKDPEDPSIGVTGELYLVDEETLKACDRLEGHPVHYRRIEVDAVSEDGSNKETTWVYEYPHAKQRDSDLIPSGDYRIYRKEYETRV